MADNFMILAKVLLLVICNVMILLTFIPRVEMSSTKVLESSYFLTSHWPDTLAHRSTTLPTSPWTSFR